MLNAMTETIRPARQEEELGHFGTNGTNENRAKEPEGKLDFDVMAQEFSKEELWTNPKTPLWETFGINLCVGLLPTLFDLTTDSLAVRDYIDGTYYTQRFNETGVYLDNCRPAENNYTECFEQDPVFSYITLTYFFFPGLGFSFWTFLNLSNFLRGTDFTFQKNVCFFLFFAPLALLSAITFPFQLLVVNVVALFNGGKQWTTLVAKFSIAEGLYDASIQFCLQLFIIFTMGDRLPSTIQYLSLSGSIFMLSVPRIEAFLLDQGGVTLPIKEKVLKTLKFFPLFFFNSIFKLGSIGLICAILRYNAISFYAFLALLWLVFYILFNEECIPRTYYHLILGVGLHLVSIGKIPGKIKTINTSTVKHHKTTVRKMTMRHQNQNIIFQNILWLVINSVMLIMLICLTHVRESLWVFWPIVDSRYPVSNLPITRFLNFIVPGIISSGLLSLGLFLLQVGCGEAGEVEEECEECEDVDPSVQGKIAKKLEPMLNVVASATDVEL